MSEELIEKIKKEYQKGTKYEDICAKFDIPRNKLVYLRNKYKWKRKSNKSKVMKNNKNGKGAEKGNKRAVTTGEYESIYEGVFSEDELQYFSNKETNYSARDELEKTYKTLIIRKVRIMKRLQKIEEDSKELNIDAIKKKNDGNSTETETIATSKDEKIIKFHDALTRVDNQILRVMERLAGIPEKDPSKTRTTSILEDINRQLGLHGSTM